MKKPKIKIKREFRRMSVHKRAGYMLKHGQYLVKYASYFVDIPYDGPAMLIIAKSLGDKFAVKGMDAMKNLEYKDQLNSCFDVMVENYDFVDFVSKGDEKYNDKSGLNSRKNTKPRTKRHKKDNAAQWNAVMNPNELYLETTRDETSRLTIVISSTEADFKVERTENSQIKIMLGDKSVKVDFSTLANMIMKKMEGGKMVDSYLTKCNANGLAALRQLPSIMPNVDLNYRRPIPLEPPSNLLFHPMNLMNHLKIFLNKYVHNFSFIVM